MALYPTYELHKLLLPPPPLLLLLPLLVIIIIIIIIIMFTLFQAFYFIVGQKGEASGRQDQGERCEKNYLCAEE
jgi:hypothetical protein